MFDKKLHFWFGLFSMLAGAAFLGVGTGFLYYATGAATGVAEVLAYIAAAILDLNGLALIVQGLFSWYSAYKS